MKHLKKAKRLIASIITMALIMSMMTISAFAATTVSVASTLSGHTFSLYQIFSGTVTEDGDLESPDWGTGVNSGDLLAALVEASADSTSALSGKFTDCGSAEDVVQVLADLSGSALTEFTEIVKENVGTTADYTISTSGDYEVEDGYYIIVDTTSDLSDDAYNAAVLQISSSITISDKSVQPTVTKKVYEEDYTTSSTYGTGYNDVADASIGDTVTFHIMAYIPSTTVMSGDGTVYALSYYDTYAITFHDTLSSGLTFGSVSAVYLSSDQAVDDSDTEIAKSEYTTTSTGLTDGCSFEVAFDDILSLTTSDGNTLSASDVAGRYIIVVYTATLNSGAVIGNNGNPNTVSLEYSNNPYSTEDTATTEEDYAVVFTFELDVTKVSEADQDTTLSGAKFYLKNSSDQYATSSDGKTISGWTSDETEAATFTSGSDGTFSIVGLDAGTYTLYESGAPDGYTVNASGWTFTISASYGSYTTTYSIGDGALTALSICFETDDLLSDGISSSAISESGISGNASTGVVEVTITNVSSTALPTTGGAGTTMLYFLGTILVAGAVVLLVVKRTRSHAA